MTRLARATLAPVALALLAVAMTTAARASEGEWLVAGGAGAAWLRQGGAWHPGGVLGLEGQYGVTDAWLLRATLDGSWHASSGDTRPRALGGSAGITYAVDVLRVIPFAELGVAVADLGGVAGGARTDLGVDVGVGAEYLLTRRWSLSLAVRARALPLGLRGDAAGTPARVGFMLRLGRVLAE